MNPATKSVLLIRDQEEALFRLWQKCTNPELVTEDTWQSDLRVLFSFGAGMQETLHFLYNQRPDFSAFTEWVGKFSAGNKNMEEEDVLTEADLEFWETNGYIVVRQAVSARECADAQQAIWEFLEASPHEPQSWYKRHAAKQGLMLLFTQHAALETNRNSTRIWNAYRQLYGSDRIYKTVDKVSFNPPETDTFKFRGSALHWDTSLSLPIPFQLQGLLYLTDVSENGGAFHCVPGFHRVIEDWLFNVPHYRDARELAVETLTPVPVAANAGDFIIWHQALPHCATPNTSDKPRMVQYLTYLPEGIEKKREWI